MPHAERNQIGVDLGEFRNLDDIPEDLAELEAALTGETAEVTDDAAASEDTDKTETSTEAAEDKDETSDTKPDKETEASDEKSEDEDSEKDKVILAQDGKSTIPYTVLKSARAQNAELKHELEAAKERLTELEMKSVPTEPTDETPAPAAAQAASEDSVEDKFQSLYGKSVSEFATEFGDEMKEVMVRQVKANLDLESKLSAVAERQQQLESTEEERAADEAAAAREEVQAAIDKVPALAEWQAAEDKTMWNAAIAVDQTLRENPEWAHASFEDRFNEVAKRLGGAVASAPETTPAPSKEELKAKADEAVKAASETVPASMSEAPGAGAQTPQTEAQKIEHLTPTQLEGMFEKMTPEQQEAYLANL